LWNADLRASLSFSPLMYAGRPFIAGIEGMKRRSLFEVVAGRLTQFTTQSARNWIGLKEDVGNLQKLISGGFNQ
jgi:hypothetical protein